MILSAREGRAESLEVTPTRQSRLPLEGVMIHTNHLVHPTLADEPQNRKYVDTSSMPRWRVLESWRGAQPAPGQISAEAMLQALSRHQGRPYSPCRHPQGDVEGATLLTTLFSLPEQSLRIYRDQPCLGRRTDYPGSFGLASRRG